jgi:phenylpyruvate tautomerase
MPFLHVVTSAPVTPAARALMGDLATLLARELGKPQAYVMTRLETGALMTFGASAEPTCCVEVKNVGTFGRELTRLLTRAITERVSQALAIPGGRIYVELVEVAPELWGHDGETFA